MKPTDIHRTEPADAAVHQSGWVPLDDDWEVTALPLVDQRVTLALGELVLARLTYRDALVVAAREGAEIIHAEHVEDLHSMALDGPQHAIEVPAFTGTPTAERTIEHSRRHDFACYHALVQAGWWWYGATLDEPSVSVPTANVGKHWVHGAPVGRSWLMGWWVSDLARFRPGLSGSGFIQPRPMPGSKGPHDDQHHDDGTTTMLVRRRASDVSALAKTDPPEPVAEAPHGYRCSVAELVADAKALGTWVPARDVLGGRYVVQPGDAIISARLGGEPESGGRGHVETASTVQAGTTVESIGANERDQWIRAPYDLRQPDFRGVIRCPPELAGRVVAACAQELAAGVRETPGPKSTARIQEYHAGARRGGSARAGMPGHEGDGVQVLGDHAEDSSVAWCASGRSFAVREALR